jgi:hypothetical protein
MSSVKSEKPPLPLLIGVESSSTTSASKIAVAEDVVRRPKGNEVRIDFALRHLRGVMAAITFTAHPCAHASRRKASNQGTRSHRPLTKTRATESTDSVKVDFLGDAFTSYIAV